MKTSEDVTVLHALRSVRILGVNVTSQNKLKKKIVKKKTNETVSLADLNFHFTPIAKIPSNPKSVKGVTTRNIICAQKALDYFNLKEGTKFKFVEIEKLRSDFNLPKRTIHLNFTAKLHSTAPIELFYANVDFPGSKRVPSASEVYVIGCCLLKKETDDNLYGIPCAMFLDAVIHPGPRYGYKAILGDKFEKASFFQLSDRVIPEHKGTWFNSSHTFSYDNVEEEGVATTS